MISNQFFSLANQHKVLGETSSTNPVDISSSQYMLTMHGTYQNQDIHVAKCMHPTTPSLQSLAKIPNNQNLFLNQHTCNNLDNNPDSMDITHINDHYIDTTPSVNSKASPIPMTNEYSEECQMDILHDQVSQIKSTKDLVNPLNLPQSAPMQEESYVIKSPRDSTIINPTQPKK